VHRIHDREASSSSLVLGGFVCREKTIKVTCMVEFVCGEVNGTPATIWFDYKKGGGFLPAFLSCCLPSYAFC